jgi:hypothetical protein
VNVVPADFSPAIQPELLPVHVERAFEVGRLVRPLVAVIDPEKNALVSVVVLLIGHVASLNGAGLIVRALRLGARQIRVSLMS